MEPIRVWYQVNTPGPPIPTIFVPLQKINSCFGTSQVARGFDLISDEEWNSFRGQVGGCREDCGCSEWPGDVRALSE